MHRICPHLHATEIFGRGKRHCDRFLQRDGRRCRGCWIPVQWRGGFLDGSARVRADLWENLARVC